MCSLPFAPLTHDVRSCTPPFGWPTMGYKAGVCKPIALWGQGKSNCWRAVPAAGGQTSTVPTHAPAFADDLELQLAILVERQAVANHGVHLARA